MTPLGRAAERLSDAGEILMCGIAGFVSGRGQASREVVERMAGRIVHRGPDEGGFHVEGNVALASRRLSIIDLAGGRQPIANEDGTIWTVYNGETYNFPQLRRELEERGHRFRTRTDTEVIVHLYEEVGAEAVSRLRGMFAFALWDARKGELLLARDRLGIKPLYYAPLPDGGIAFGSELKSLLAHPEVSRDLDFEALFLYLTLFYVPSPWCIFRGVRKLPPGHILTFRPGSAPVVRPYWNLRIQPEERFLRQGFQRTAAELREKLSETVREHLIADVPVGVFLSGGVDSSAIAALAREHAGAGVMSFTIGMPDRQYDERHFARIVARHLETNHVEEVAQPDLLADLPRLVWHADEPFGDSSILPTYLVSRLAAQHVKVVLSGDGGDELFAGYNYYRTFGLLSYFFRLPRGLRAAITRGVQAIPPSLLNRLLSLPPLRLRSTNSLSRVEKWIPALGNASLDQVYVWSRTWIGDDLRRSAFQPELAARAGTGAAEIMARLMAAAGEVPLIDRIMYTDTRLSLPEDMLTKVDRMSMATSLEVRVPLCDHEVAEFAAGVPYQWKVRGLTTKRILKEAVRPLLPPEILVQRKQGFSIPLGEWLRGPASSVVGAILQGERARKRGWFNHEVLRDVLDAHVSGREDHRFLLWGLLILEVWARLYLDEDLDAPPEVRLTDLI